MKKVIVLLFSLIMLLIILTSCMNPQTNNLTDNQTNITQSNQSSNSMNSTNSNEDCTNQICLDENCFDIEIPRTSEDMRQGLMNREYLPENQGMLFIFQYEGKHSFWMKNTLIPLDMIWINEELEVVDIQAAVPCKEDPCTIYTPNQTALYVLEINAGLANELEITNESQVKLDIC